jgi:hypothetical protein
VVRRRKQEEQTFSFLEVLGGLGGEELLLLVATPKLPDIQSHRIELSKLGGHLENDWRHAAFLRRVRNERQRLGGVEA